MSDLWELVWGKPEVDPIALLRAIEQELGSGNPDFRTRLLIRDSTQALERHWGAQQYHKWMSRSPVRAKIEGIQREDLGRAGFPMLKEQLMESTQTETVKEFLRELGTRIQEPATLEVGGSIALILTGYLSRATADIDVVDEVPVTIRCHEEVLADLKKRYGLLLTHFQSHYLPAGWQERLQLFGQFGSLKVYTLDVYDVFLGKLFSNRTKDLDDLRSMKPQIEKRQLARQLQSTTAALLNESPLRQAAERNWYILYGENLPAQGIM